MYIELFLNSKHSPIEKNLPFLSNKTFCVAEEISPKDMISG